MKSATSMKSKFTIVYSAFANAYRLDDGGELDGRTEQKAAAIPCFNPNAPT